MRAVTLSRAKSFATAVVLAAFAMVLVLSCRPEGSSPSPSAGPPGKDCPASDQAKERYRSCRQSKDAEECARNGGDWSQRPGGFSQGPVMACACELPDAGCPCDEAGDCMERCRLTPPADWSRCPPSGPATCTGSGHGCFCLVDSKGKVEGLCQD